MMQTWPLTVDRILDHGAALGGKRRPSPSGKMTAR